MKNIVIFILFILFFNIAYAEVMDTYSFQTTEQKTQFNYLTEQLRCLVCQNETLADSNAPLAQDLRSQIAALVKQKQSNESIIHYLTQRYGDFILFRPPLRLNTVLLWLLPFVLVFGGLLLTIFILIRRQSQGRIELSSEQQRVLNDT